MSESLVAVSSPRQLSCLNACASYASVKGHHDRLLTVEHDLDALLELFELAVTWGELDYSEQRLIEPAGWPAFVAAHRWQSATRVQQIFELARDVAVRSGRMNLVVGMG